MMIFRLSFLLKVGQMKVCQYPYLLSTCAPYIEGAKLT